MVIVTELFQLSAATEPAVFHEPWWLTLVPQCWDLNYDWGREALVMALVVVGIAAVFGTLAVIASRYALWPP